MSSSTSETKNNNNCLEEDKDNNSSKNRGQNALQRRAQQLKRWHEIQEKQEFDSKNSKKSKIKVKFSSATLFLSSVAQNDIQECERLLRIDPHLDVNVTTGDGLTALHQMAIDDNIDMCRWLINHRADVNCRDNEGWTPLHAAASCGHYEIVKLLLSREECDVFAINCDGELARDVCDGDDCLQLIDDRMRRHLDVKYDDIDDSEDGIPEPILTEIRNKEVKQIENDFKEFLEKNPKLNSKIVSQWIESTRDQTSGATVIHVCAAKGYNEVLNNILSIIGEYIDLDSLLDLDGFTALHSSAFWRQMTSFEILLKFGANFELKTRDSRVVADLCHENPKIMELISETLKEREKQRIEENIKEDNNKTTTTTTTAETQRKLNAKRQRETRRPTQGVTKEDIEMALKTAAQVSSETTESPVMTSPPSNTTTTAVPLPPPEVPSIKAELNETPPPMPSSPPPTTVVSLTPPTTANCVSTTVSVPLYPQRRRQKRRSTGIETESVAPTGGDAADEEEVVVCVDSQKPILSSSRPSMSSFGSWRTSLNPRSSTATRGRPSPSTTSSALSRSLSQLPFGSSSSQMPFITTAPSYQTTCATHRRQPHLNRRQSQPSSPATQSRLRGASSQSNLTALQNASNALNSVFVFKTPQTTPSDAQQWRSRSSSRSSVGQTTDDEQQQQRGEDSRRQSSSSSTTGKSGQREQELDYKKLYNELLKENAFLIKKIKEMEVKKDNNQEYQREKRQLMRRISELEEELKQKEDLIKENIRLKDENSALIRVISKLSK